MSRWGAEGPPADAYSRVSNPERFRPLHDVALRLLEQLQAAFDAEAFEGYGLDSELETGEPARPVVRLVPRDQMAAPLAIVFTTFPGLRVRFGRWQTMAFPACGCDACDETASDEAARLAALVDDVTAGRFREALSSQPDGSRWQESEFWSPRHHDSSRSRVDHAHDGEMPAAIEWKPWPRRA